MAAINAVTDLSTVGKVSVITLNSPPVNALSAQVRDGLFQAFKQASADSATQAIKHLRDSGLARTDEEVHAGVIEAVTHRPSNRARPLYPV